MGEEYAKWLADYVWDSFKSRFGRTPSRITKLELEHLTKFFVEECAERGIDPETIDFLNEIFEDASYYELKDKIVEILDRIASKPPEPIELGLEEAKERLEDLGFRIKEEDLRKIENVKALEEKIERLRRTLEKLRKDLEMEKAKREAAQRELERLKGVAPPPTPAPTPPAPPPKELKEVDIEKLRKLWELEIRRVLGKYPREAALYFDVELLPVIKSMPFEKAREIVIREAEAFVPTTPPLPIAPPAPKPYVPPARVPPEEEAVRRAIPPERVEPPAAPLEPMPFPRRIASSEMERFWKAFRYRLWELGLEPEEYMEHWYRFRDAWYSDWFAVLRAFEGMIDDIKKGLAPKVYPRPPIWKELPRDAILHLLATKVYRNIEQLIEALNFHGVYVTAEEIKEIVKKEWRKEPKDSWLLVTPKEYLCEVLGLSPEELP